MRIPGAGGQSGAKEEGGKQLKSGGGFGSLNILEGLGGLFVSIYWEFRII